jgi:hypothetical protein
VGGFKPSRSDIDSSTSVGADITLDSHQFTGSVDITGSLMLNGSAVTGGGGGGAVADYTNSGNNRVITSVDSDTINGEANLSFDGSDLVVAAGDVSASAGLLSSSAGVFFAGNMTGSGHIAIGKIGVGPGGDTIAADVGRTATLFVKGESRFQGSVNASHIPIDGGAENIFLRPGTNSGDVIMADSSATMNVGIGVSSPQAKLHVSSSGTEPLFRIDQSFQAGDKPILFITGSGLVGIGTDAPRGDSEDTNRVHILGESGADQGQDPVDNTVLMLENNSHAAVQFMTPANTAGIIAWGSPSVPRQANLYYGVSGNRYHFEGAGFGAANVMTIHAGGNSVNIGQSQAAHMQTSTACLAISSSTGGTDIGGPVLLKVDHADQPGAEPIMFVTGSGRVGIGTGAPESTLEVQGNTGLSGSLEFSGTLATTSLSTLVGVMGLVNVDRAATTIDVSGQATNTMYTFGIANGTITGQRKDIFMKIAADGTIDGSNSINLTGSNIASGQPGASNGSLQLTGTDGGGGSQFAQPQGGASLMWDGTDWLVLGVNGAQHSGF